PHTTLPSFPTRRSSDLIREALERAKARFEELTQKLADPSIHQNPAELRKVSKERSSLEDLVDAARRYDEVLHRIAEDTALLRTENRKSTRLNSSHDQIS